jgi:TRAP-type C4-dicarboxylate transport system permease small subunit
MARRVLDSIINLAAALAGILIVIVMLAVCAKVLSRYFLGTGIVGIDQLSGTMLVYITFLSAAWVLKRREHVNIDLLLVALRGRARLWVELLGVCLGAFVCLLIAWFGVLETFDSWRRGVRIAAEIEMLRAYTIAIIPLGSALLFIQFLRDLRSKLNEIRQFGKA